MSVKRRLAAILLMASLLAALGGCASVFDKEYVSIAPYVDADEGSPQPVGGASEVKNYFGLKLAITRMVNVHEETATLNFRQYDGVISEDIASACREVATGTALGDYCVDYISYDLERIVAYYEAVITVSYKRDAEELASIIRLSGAQTVYDALREAMNELEPSVVIMGNAAGADRESIHAFIERAWHEDPLICVNKPLADAKVYSGGGLQRIFEVSLDYGASKEELISRSVELSERVEALAETINARGDANLALSAAGVVMSECISDETAGDTAWDALMDGRASSEGVAAAYKAVCDRAGVDCRVVVGRLNKQRHCWNVISVAGDWYHADLFRAPEDGLPASFLRPDSAFWGDYWWDVDEYPVCDGRLSYASVFGEEPTPEPTPSPTPDESPTPTPEVSAEPESPSPPDETPEQNT